ncbi:MAG TPA: HAD family hydrolase [Anaerolineae bacterium]|nr:HAD family hydrolase [Anaerolineae bacterium]
MAYLEGTAIEIVHRDIPRGHVRVALFDFDGTLSLIRQGWQEVMQSLMVAILLQTPRHESVDELRAAATELIDRLTGEQTVNQMAGLAQEVARRGGRPANPQEYKRQYLDRLRERIEPRIAALKSGQVVPDEALVAGSRALLESLRSWGITCYLASGTDEVAVRGEATALGIAGYFAEIHGARDGDPRASKNAVIEQIMREHSLRGDAKRFVAFGDGRVEVESTKRVGGLAVGVASNEVKRRGVNDRKREHLIQAGADIIVPDFDEHKELIAFLFGL